MDIITHHLQVAEDCILKWIKKCVKPVLLLKQEDGHLSVVRGDMLCYHYCTTHTVALLQEESYRHLPPPRMDSREFCWIMLPNNNIA